MIPQEIELLKSILESFLGNAKKDLDDSYQLQFGCPRCAEHGGEKEHRKYNLEVNLQKGVFNCWSCGQYDDEMHGSISKLIKLYGNETILKDYNTTVKRLRESKLYQLKFNDGDFNIEINSIEKEEVALPPNFKQFLTDGYNPPKALDYIKKRGINWDIIKKHKIGYTFYDENYKMQSSRIIIPSFNEYGELNYWVGRDFTNISKRQKYCNPIIEKKDIIFNESLINWDADITLVEGPFDHIVVPNSIPLLGKVLKTDFKIYQSLNEKANANINIFLDGDAFQDVKKIYDLLNHNKLYGKIRFIPVEADLDPSKIYELYGTKGIAKYMSQATKINPIALLKQN